MTDLSSLVGGPDRSDQPQSMRGIVVQAPVNIDDVMLVVCPAFSTDFYWEISEHQWMPRSTGLPQVNDFCLVVLDEIGDAWVPVWGPVRDILPNVVVTIILSYESR